MLLVVLLVGPLAWAGTPGRAGGGVTGSASSPRPRVTPDWKPDSMLRTSAALRGRRSGAGPVGCSDLGGLAGGGLTADERGGPAALPSTALGL